MYSLLTIVAEKASKLEGKKRATEKRAEASTKHLNKKWLRQEYAVELASAIEEQVNKLPKDGKMVEGACRAEDQAIPGAALRGGDERRFDRFACRRRVESRISSLLSDLEDELTQGVLSGHSAGETCAAALGAQQLAAGEPTVAAPVERSEELGQPDFFEEVRAAL